MFRRILCYRIHKRCMERQRGRGTNHGFERQRTAAAGCASGESRAPSGKPAGAEEKTELPKSRSDRTTWSQNALAFLQEVNRQDMERQRKLLEAREQKNGELEMLSKSLDVMEKCRKIASRIMKGDKVPPQDQQFLMEADPEGYKLAIVCRTPKEKPKEWESVLEEEKESGATGSGDETAESGDSTGEAAEC